MSVFKTTFSRALQVFPSSNCDIPFPNVITSGAATAYLIDSLEDNTADFIALNIKAGDIVYNMNNTQGATVISVLNATKILLNADIFSAGGESYTIYQASPQTGLGNQGCYLYIPEDGGSYEVITIGGDNVTFAKPQIGLVLPIQVKRLISGGGPCIALW